MSGALPEGRPAVAGTVRVSLLVPALLALAARVPGQEKPAPPPALPSAELSAQVEEVQEEPAADEDSDDGEERPSFRWTRFRLNGRAIGRWQSTRQDNLSESELDLENARLTLNWRPARWLRGQLEYDPAMNRKLKDAFLRVRTDALSLRGGQFKPPFSGIAMDSRWDLPVSERGQLDEVLRDSMGIVGRRPGLQLGYQPRGGDLDILAGMFRASSVDGERIGRRSFNNLAEDWAAKVTARAQHERRRLRLGASADWRPAEPRPGEGDQRFWTLGADVAWRQRRKEGGWRLWGEGYLGSTWQDADPLDGVDATFVAAQAIAAWRHGGRKAHAFYLEPYSLLSIFDPDTRIRNDLMWEAAGGVNVGRWDQLRFTVEVQHRSVDVNAPPSLGLVIVDAAPYSRTRLVLQLGGAF
jgi:hypothetical protein